MQALRVLRVGHNRLTALPRNLGRTCFRVVVANHNLLGGTPGDLWQMTSVQARAPHLLRAPRRRCPRRSLLCAPLTRRGRCAERMAQGACALERIAAPW